MVVIKEDASFVEVPACQTLIIAKNAYRWKKIEMAVRKLLIWEVLKLTYFMKEKNTISKRDECLYVYNVFSYINGLLNVWHN